ncbi:hypothetical protein ElyMa_002314400 [Elysia marginata]|uniref:Uncharacterized protein n=1 Tax=Elysia marginata TaxID=1093978 RepID=A0AAV4G4V8_9GAST|nr:hypothetical protein ElyMa_002314400 [Elysia marginata]
MGTLEKNPSYIMEYRREESCLPHFSTYSSTTLSRTYPEELNVYGRWCKEEHATAPGYRMQLAANKLKERAEKRKVTINTEKSFTKLFTLSSPTQSVTPYRIGDTILKHEEEPTYLRITLDKHLTWRAHVNEIEAMARRKLAIMRKLARTT